MKVLHTADLHLGKTLNGYSLLDDQKYILEKIEEIIISQNVDVCILAGDIFDRAITSQEALDLFCDFLDFIYKNDIHLIAILGNHDGERIAFTSRILRNSKIHIIKNPEKVKIDNVCFSCIPYLDIHEFRDFYNEDFKTVDEAYLYTLEDFGLTENNYNIMVAHDYFTHNRESLIESDSEIKNLIGGLEYLEVDMFKGYNYVALGHLHNPQKVGYENIRYSGSILKYSFSEAKSNKSVVILDTETDEFIKCPLVPKRDLVDITGSVDELTNPVFYHNYNYNNDYFRAILTKIDGDAYQRLKAIYPNLMEIKIDVENDIRVVERRKIKENDYLELFKMFYHEMEKEEISSDELMIVKDYLIGGIE